MLQEMMQPLLAPNVVSWSAAISASDKGKRGGGEALGLLREMMQQSLTPNVVSWNASMSACEKGKQ